MMLDFNKVGWSRGKQELELEVSGSCLYKISFSSWGVMLELRNGYEREGNRIL